MYFIFELLNEWCQLKALGCYWLSTFTWSCFQKTFLYTHDMAERPKKKKESVVQQQHGQLYRRHANTMALSSSPVVSALGSESDDLGSSPGQGKVLCPWDMQEKKCKLCFLAWLNLYIIPMTWLQGQKNKNQLSRSNSGWHFHLLLVVEVVPSLTH